MPPQTRNRGQTLTPAPAPASGSASASRVYHSSPAPQQLHFPARRRVVKTYGHSRPGSARARALRQQTLTQIDYVKQADSEAEAPGLLPPSTAESGATGEKEERPKKRRKTMGDSPIPAATTRKERPQKRAKAERPEKRRKTMGDTPNPNSSSSFHTQTLTQFLSEKSFSEKEEEEEGLLRVKDSDDDGDEDEKGELPKRESKGAKGKEKSRELSVVPQTPSTKKIRVNLDEVPSSQPTPFTPMVERYSPIGANRSPLKDKSTNVDAPPPTLETVSKRPRTMVIQDTFSTVGSSPSTQRAKSSPLKQVSSARPERPHREPLAELPVASFDLGEMSDEQVEQTPTRPRPARNGNRVFAEIPDSDDEPGSLGPTPVKAASGQHRTPHKPIATVIPSTGDSNKENYTPNIPVRAVDAENSTETSTDDDIGPPGTPTPMARKVRPLGTAPVQHETPQRANVIELPSTDGSAKENNASVAPAPVDESIDTAAEEEEMEPPGTPTPVARNVRHSTVQHATPQRVNVIEVPSTGDSKKENGTSALPAQATEEGLMGASAEEAPGPPGTPTPVARKVRIELPPSHRAESLSSELSPPPAVSKESSPILPRHTQTRSQRFTQVRSQLYSQGWESQRVPMDVIRSMGPQTDRSDILISIHPEPVEEIVNGSKTYEFRNYKFPIQVSRCWIYVTRPVAEVKYMATLGPAKQPGEIDDDGGAGNAEFNSEQSGYKFAHELVQVYQLNNPVPLAEMKENGLGDSAPQKYRYLPPAIVGQLLANLRCALFAEGGEGEEYEEVEKEAEQETADDTGKTISQELEEQIRSDISHSTQLMLSSEGHGQEEVIPESQALPSLATTTTTTTTRSTTRAVTISSPDLPRMTRASTRIQSQKQSQQNLKTPSTVRKSSQRRKSQQTPSTVRIRKEARAGPVPPSQATTASEPSSPTQVSPEKSSVPRPPMSSSSVPSLSNHVDEGSPIRIPRGTQGRSLGESSSQAMLLPDSLLVDDFNPPPPVIWDSEDEDI
ncbi:hypothetical protein QBC46DRAFT_431357 [Diplogelasinospora grovesii]|uniref:Uncharacterized protein n=1 Tax=Diplogelasinospora grovesii TaxID=303347 RepID=A0AAN6S539_9PEZI|nr:hypothetical protein QBC46DRAFT_431357 [Diplogelasinospora grovesii]